MTIDLSQFVDKEVLITLRNGDVYETLLFEDPQFSVPYCFVNKLKVKQHHRKNGIFWFQADGYTTEIDIVNIQLKNQPKEMNVCKLSNETFQKLADALTPGVIDYIEKDERYVLFMQEVIPDSLSHMMGKLDDDLHFELSMAIMDRISMKASKWMKS